MRLRLVLITLLVSLGTLVPGVAHAGDVPSGLNYQEQLVRDGQLKVWVTVDAMPQSTSETGSSMTGAPLLYFKGMRAENSYPSAFRLKVSTYDNSGQMTAQYSMVVPAATTLEDGTVEPSTGSLTLADPLRMVGDNVSFGVEPL